MKEHRLYELEADERQLKNYLSNKKSNGGNNIDVGFSPRYYLNKKNKSNSNTGNTHSPRTFRRTKETQRKHYAKIKIESELINNCVQAFDSKIKVTQDLLVARTEMMVLDDSIVTLDMKALKQDMSSCRKLLQIM